MDILDTQIHIGPGGIEEGVAAMNAIGIRRALIDEYWVSSGADDLPSYTLANGARRPIHPTAELASWTHPDRFSYLVRVQRRDPEACTLIRLAGEAYHARAIRFVPGMDAPEVAAFAAGEYDPLFAAVAESGMPVFVFIAGNTALLTRYLDKYPGARVVIDHCGMPPGRRMRDVLKSMPGNEHYTCDGTGDEDQPALAALFDELLARIADRPNVALKWAHAASMFNVSGTSSPELRPHLHRAIDVLGADRVMWASDVSANMTGESWADILGFVANNLDLSEDERSAILGGTARRWLDWPA